MTMQELHYFAQALPALQAEKALNDLVVADFPHNTKDRRRKLHKSLLSQIPIQDETITMKELVQSMNGGKE